MVMGKEKRWKGVSEAGEDAKGVLQRSWRAAFVLLVLMRHARA